MYNSFPLLDEVCDEDELLEEELCAEDDELLLEELCEEADELLLDEELCEDDEDEELLLEEDLSSLLLSLDVPLTVEEVLSLTVSSEVVPLTLVPLCSLPCTVELVPLVEAGAEEETSSFFLASLHPQRSTAKIKNKTKYFFIIKTSFLCFNHFIIKHTFIQQGKKVW